MAVTPSKIGVTEGYGKNLDTVELTTALGKVEREVVTIGSPSDPDLLAEVTEDGGVQSAATIIGSPDGDFATINLLEQLMDSSSGLTANVLVANQPKLDALGALSCSDADKELVFVSQNVVSPMYIDTTGYNSVVVQSVTTGIITPTVSNDKLTFYATMGYTAATGTPSATIAAAGVYMFPVTAKWMKLTGPATGVKAFVYLRQTICPMITMNLGQVAGTATVTGGVAGIQAIGGNIAEGTAATANPVLVGGVQYNRSTTGTITYLTRRMATDASGHQIVMNQMTAPDGTEQPMGSMFSQYRNVSAQTVIDVTRDDDGLTSVEFLDKILFELRLMNHYLYNLPGNLNAGVGETDDPASFRADPSVFNIN